MAKDDGPVDDRRMPASARGLTASLRRLRGLLKRPLRVKRRGLQWDVVVVERRVRPALHQEPTPREVCLELRARLLSLDQAAGGLRALMRVHDELRRKGWGAVECLKLRDLTKALAQAQLLARVEPTPAMALLLERLRLYRAAAEVRAERRADTAAQESERIVEVRETSFDEYEMTERTWFGTIEEGVAR